MSGTFERDLTERAWADPEFAAALETDPEQTLRQFGVDVPDGVRLSIRLQRRNTLYFLLPPLREAGDDLPVPINSIDLWQSGDLFCWLIPDNLKVQLLGMRRSYGGREG